HHADESDPDDDEAEIAARRGKAGDVHQARDIVEEGEAEDRSQELVYQPNPVGEVDVQVAPQHGQEGAAAAAQAPHALTSFPPSRTRRASKLRSRRSPLGAPHRSAPLRSTSRSI